MMQAVRNLRGMRFPDVYVVRMFFKEGLQRSPGRVLELGCGSGNNLRLFHEFDWQVVGIDISAELLSDAAHNLSDRPETVTLLQADLAHGMPQLTGQFDAIVLPNFNCYIPRSSFFRILAECNALLAPGGLFFVISRTRQDWRFGRGREVERDGFVLDFSETGEKGLLNVFYDSDDLRAMVEGSLGSLRPCQILKMRYENAQNGAIVTNDEVVIWGRRS
jgi:SAM-dependent methyltransferase